MKYFIWEANVYKPLVELRNPEMVKKILNIKCVEERKTFIEAEKDIEIIYYR